MKKRIFQWTIGVLVVCILIDIGASLYFYRLVIERNVKDFLSGNQDLKVSAKALEEFFEGDWRTWQRKQTFETWEMESFDGLKLKAYFLEAKQPTKNTVIFVHGYLSRAADMGIYAQYYYEDLGYNVLSLDLRGHGNSEGDYIGFGWHDRLDILDWVNVAIDKLGTDVEIVLHGVSMGASAVLMASGEDVPKQVKAIVADSPYSNVYDLFQYQMKRMYHLPAFPILPSTSLVAKMRAGYSFQEASALKQVKKSEIPILYIHGSDDAFVPVDMAWELYENTKSPAEIIIFEHAKHTEAFALDKEKYASALTRFLQTHMD